MKKFILALIIHLAVILPASAANLVLSNFNANNSVDQICGITTGTTTARCFPLGTSLTLAGGTLDAQFNLGLPVVGGTPWEVLIINGLGQLAESVALNDSSGNGSVGFFDRKLYTMGGSVVFDWASVAKFPMLVDGFLKVTSGDGTITSVSSPNLQEVTDAGNITTNQLISPIGLKGGAVANNANIVVLDADQYLFNDSAGLPFAKSNTRSLFNEFGTVVAQFDASQLYLRNNSGNAVVNWGFDYLVDNSGVVSVDWGNRALKNNAGSTLIDYSSAINFYGAYTFPPSDGPALTFLQTDGAGNISWAAAGSGSSFLTANQIAFGDPSNIQTSSPNLQFDDATPMFTTPSITVSNLYATVGALFADLNNYHIFDDTGSISIDYANRWLVHPDGTTRLNWLTSLLLDSAAGASEDWENRILFYPGGGGISSVNWGAGLLSDFSGLDSISYTLRQMWDSTGPLSIDWQNRILYNTLGTFTVDWNGETLFNSSGSPTVSWQSMQLYDSTTTLSADWSLRILMDAAGTISDDWDHRFLFDATGNKTVDYDSDTLFDDTASVSLDWKLRHLYNTSSILVLDYSGTVVDALVDIKAEENINISNKGKTLSVTGGGSNATSGTATLVGGTVTITTTAITANSMIFLSAPRGTLVNIGVHDESSRSPGSKFVINSVNILDSSTFDWWLVEKN